MPAADPPITWTPDAETARNSELAAFARRVAFEHGGPDPGDYHALWRWSVADVERFWSAIWDHFRVEASTPPLGVLGSRAMPGAEWFPGARLSYARHVFRDREDAAPAIHHASELRGLETWSWRRLRDETERIATGLLRLGVGPGDRVAACLPNVPETIAAFLACASVGAIWSSAAPEFGTRAIVDRFAQIAPRVLLAVDGYRYAGREFDRREMLGDVAGALPSVEHVVTLEHLGTGAVAGSRTWDELRSMRAPLTFAELPFSHPLWILYTSGTTGLPKAIVHGQGGILLEHLKSLHLHLDARPDDRVFWFTTTGWMMWNYLTGCLLTPASIVLYDGQPDPEALWDLGEEAAVTIFGVSAAFLAACAKAGVSPRRGRRLARLRAVGSTGSPLAPETEDWVRAELDPATWLLSLSGGTDVCTAFLGGVPTLPAYRGELQARALGADVHAFDPDGRSRVDERGELVVTQPMPSMPLAFWGDADGSRLRDAYFAEYPRVWRHGDWVEITRRGTAIVSGRSDATINRGGVRMGTSELYRAVLAEDVVLDAVAVDLPRPGTDGWLALFVALQAGVVCDDELVSALRRRIRADCSPRHVPDLIRQVPAIPRTLSGKVLEVPVKRILLGEPVERVASRDTLADPGALDWFVTFAARADGSAAPSR